MDEAPIRSIDRAHPPIDSKRMNHGMGRFFAVNSFATYPISTHLVHRRLKSPLKMFCPVSPGRLRIPSSKAFKSTQSNP